MYNYHFDVFSVASHNDKSRIPTILMIEPPVEEEASQNTWSLIQAKLQQVEIPNQNDLTLISRIYLKNQPNRTERISRLLKQWKQHEELKVSFIFFTIVMVHKRWKTNRNI